MKRRQVLIGGAAASLLAGCGMMGRREPLNFVLVHGSWHGPWCWDKLVPVLRADGHQVTAVDLHASKMGEPLYRSVGFTDPTEPELRWRAP